MGAVHPLPPGPDPVLALGVLSATDMTAYFAMMEIGKQLLQIGEPSLDIAG